MLKENHDIIFGTGATLVERLRISSSGFVMIGTTTEGHTSADDLTIANTGNSGITIRSGTTSNGAIFFSDATSGDGEFDGFVQYNHGDAPKMMFGVSDDTFLTITSVGDVTTTGVDTFAIANVGFTARKNDSVSITRASGTPLEINRTGDDGELIKFYQDGTEAVSYTHLTLPTKA